MSSSDYSLMDDFAKNKLNGRSRLTLKRGSDIEMRSIDWIWPGILARQILTLIAGEGGVGKTMLLCQFAAVLSRGGIYPGTRDRVGKGRALFLSGEDNADTTLMPRFVASGGDPDYIDFIDDLAGKDYFSIGEHIHDLEATIQDLGDVSLLIIDPITTFCGSNFDANQVGSVRPNLSQLTALAKRTNISVIILSHLTKDDKRVMKNRITGSGSWVHAPRIVLGVGESEEHGLVMGKIKVNIHDEYGVYPYSIETKKLENHDGVLADHVYAEWKDYTLPNIKFEEIIEVEAGTVHGEKAGLACTIITETLADGKEHTREEVIQAAAREGISEATVKKAASKMNLYYGLTNTVPPKGIWQLQHSNQVQPINHKISN